MEKQDILNALKKAKEISQKRNFKQSVDLIINFKGLDLKKPDNQVELYITIPFSKGKKVKVCGLVGTELTNESKNSLDQTILTDEFDVYAKDKKLTKKLARQFDFFVAQANIMPKVATAFGRYFGPKGKMPNPKAGCVVPPNANLKALYERLQKTVKVSVKVSPIYQGMVGMEDTNDNEIVENVMTIYNTVMHSLPNGTHNIKNSYLKLTMGKPVKIGEKEAIVSTKKVKKVVTKEATETGTPSPTTEKVKKASNETTEKVVPSSTKEKIVTKNKKITEEKEEIKS